MRGSQMQKGKVIWITGLSGSGKSSLARLLSSQLRTQGMIVVMLDGDELRDVFGASTPNTQNHSRQGRLNRPGFELTPKSWTNLRGVT